MDSVSPVDWNAVAADLAPIECLADRASLRAKSRDFFWYSPVLNEKLKGVSADLVVCPANEAELIRTLAYCHQRRIPVTPRGGGTGNYGQAMPLQGGIVLDLLKLDRFLWLKDGVARVEAGLKLIDLERHTLPQGWELRFHPSTRRTATIGGFIAGGSGGVGSVQFGGLRARGNVLGLRLVTMEAEPRAVELRGEEVMPAVHAYGTNGVIVELEMPLARSWPWREIIVSFPDIGAAAQFGNALCEADGIVRKLVTVCDWQSAQYFRPLLAHLTPGKAIALCVVADPSLEAFEALSAAMGGATVFQRDAAETGDIPPLYEFTWNHTTLWALKADRSITYLQCLFDGPDYLDKIARTVATFGGETPMHLEFTRLNGHVAAFGLQLVRYKNEARLYEIIHWLEANDCPVADPHTYILEDGGMKTVDEAQLAFKRQTDPLGLLNPGKMKAWSPSCS
ncbi:MAG: FAD-binding oxidoreductase [Reyranella sp.]|nr:FAD-binding oxidoreductase [Reyranella sp.]